MARSPPLSAAIAAALRPVSCGTAGILTFSIVADAFSEANGRGAVLRPPALGRASQPRGSMPHQLIGKDRHQ